jgi:BMFP domain-containing protein YqiC
MDMNPPTMGDIAFSMASGEKEKRMALEKRVAQLEALLRELEARIAALEPRRD